MHIHAAGGCKRSSHEEQRVAGQKRRDHQSRFTKNNGKQDGVNQDAIVIGQPGQMLIKMQNNIEELRDVFQGKS